MSCPPPSQARTPARVRLNASYLNLALWTFQGWLAMVFVAAGYAKLTVDAQHLISLLGWPALVPDALVSGLGVAEVILALMVLAPLVSWRVGRPLLLTAAAGLLVLEIVMLTIHAIRLDLGLALFNMALAGITLPVLWFRAREIRQG